MYKLSDCLKFVVALHTQAVILETSAVDMQYVLRKKDCMGGVILHANVAQRLTPKDKIIKSFT